MSDDSILANRRFENQKNKKKITPFIIGTIC